MGMHEIFLTSRRGPRDHWSRHRLGPFSSAFTAWVLSILVSCVALPAAAADFYVDPNNLGATCSDDNRGDLINEPLCTIGEVNTRVKRGDVVYLREGTHTEAI